MSHLDDAIVALEETRLEDALDALLLAWRAKKSALIAERVEELGNIFKQACYDEPWDEHLGRFRPAHARRGAGRRACRAPAHEASDGSPRDAGAVRAGRTRATHLHPAAGATPSTVGVAGAALVCVHPLVDRRADQDERAPRRSAALLAARGRAGWFLVDQARRRPGALALSKRSETDGSGLPK